MNDYLPNFTSEQVGPNQCHSKCYECLRSLSNTCKGDVKPCRSYKHLDTEFRNLPQVCGECHKVYHYVLYHFREQKLCYTCLLKGYESESESMNLFGSCSVTEQVGYSLDNLGGSAELLSKETFDRFPGSVNVSFVSGE